MHFVSLSCIGVRCSMCGQPAAHKVGEEMMSDDPNPIRHNLTAYVCCTHFSAIMGMVWPCDKAVLPEPKDWDAGLQ